MFQQCYNYISSNIFLKLASLVYRHHYVFFMINLFELFNVRITSLKGLSTHKTNTDKPRPKLAMLVGAKN